MDLRLFVILRPQAEESIRPRAEESIRPQAEESISLK